MKKNCYAIKLIFLAFGMSTACWACIAPFIKKNLSLDNAEFGLILLISGIGPIIALPLSGWLMKRFRSNVVTVISGLASFALLPVLTLLSSFSCICTALFISGGATNIMNIAINTQAVAIESESRQSLMSSFHCLFSIGGVLGIALMGLLLEFNLDLFYCAFLNSMFISLIMLSQQKNLLSSKSPSTSLKKQKGIFERGLVSLGLLYFVSIMGEGCVLNWGAEFLSSSLQYQACHAGIGYAIFQGAMIGGRLLGDKLILRFGQFFTFQMSCFMGAFGFIILFTTLWPYAELLGFFLVGLGISNITPILLSLAGKFSKIGPGYALSFVTFFGHIGGLIAPVWMGFVANASSLALVFGCMAAALLIIGLCGPALRRIKHITV